ncbi:MAG: GTPase HflX [Alphaproteobacteria bacterium]|nr:GTPase HflX [Alphaproteobacteria bacterium]
MARELIERSPRDEVAALVLPIIGRERRAGSRLEESAGLVEALGVKLAFAEQVHVRDPNPARLFGSGQLDALLQKMTSEHVTLLIVDGALTPVQQRNLETALRLKVVDRTGLILEIFGLRARTAEGRLQVEMARSLYERSRLVRTWTHLERQRGGFGFLGGPGETQLEADRRMLDKRIAGFRHDLDDVRRTRKLQREGRARRGAPVAALVGYTNSGKSTLFNRLTSSDVLAADMPFATLDPTAREIVAASGRKIALIDTVGFITDLPTHLIAAFRATLEEAMEADILVHVRDIAHPDTESQAEDVYGILEQISAETGLSRPPVIEVWNKIDILPAPARALLMTRAETHSPPVVMASALTGEGVETLLFEIENQVFRNRRLRTVTLRASDGRARAWLHKNCEVQSEAMAGDADLTLLAYMSDTDVARLMAFAPDARISDQAALTAGSDSA